MSLENLRLLWRKLNTPVGRRFGRTIGPETRVDPALFSEAEFPVWCLRCGYLLKALPEARCPECGRAFDRGRLLLEEYLLRRAPRSDVSLALVAATLGVVLLPMPFTQLMRSAIEQGAVTHRAAIVAQAFLALRLVSFIGLAVVTGLVSRRAKRRRGALSARELSRKARIIAAAIQDKDIA